MRALLAVAVLAVVVAGGVALGVLRTVTEDIGVDW